MYLYIYLSVFIYIQAISTKSQTQRCACLNKFIDRDHLLQWGNLTSSQTQIGRYFLLAMFLKEEKVKNSFYS